MYLTLTRRCASAVRIAAGAVLVAASACSEADGPIAPQPQPAPSALDTAGRLFGLRTRAGDVSSLVVAVDDAVDRLIPALGDAPRLVGVRTAFVAIGSALAGGSASSAANGEGVAGAVRAARILLGALSADAATVPELDALLYTLDVVESGAPSR